MFDIAWSEFALIGLVALIVIGPKDLPAALYTAGKWMRKARLLARDFQSHIDDMVREAELEELRRQAAKATDFSLKAEVGKLVDPDQTLLSSLSDPIADTRAALSGAAADPVPAPVPAPVPSAPEAVPVEAASIAPPPGEPVPPVSVPPASPASMDAAPVDAPPVDAAPVAHDSGVSVPMPSALPDAAPAPVPVSAPQTSAPADPAPVSAGH